MPLHDYRCGDCTAEFEILVRGAKSSPPSACPECGSTTLARKLAGFAIASSELDKIRAQDPKYKQIVDSAMRESASYADPNRYLEKMIPFDAADNPGDPIDI